MQREILFIKSNAEDMNYVFTTPLQSKWPLKTLWTDSLTYLHSHINTPAHILAENVGLRHVTGGSLNLTYNLQNCWTNTPPLGL